MWINLQNGTSDDMVEDFLRNVLRDKYYADERKPGLNETIQIIETMEWFTLRGIIFNMLLQHRIKTVLEAELKLKGNLNFNDVISKIIDIMQPLKDNYDIAKYFIIYNRDVLIGVSETVTIEYSKSDHDYRIVIQL